MLDKTNNIVHSLWIGKELSPLELLTLKSFTFHGYNFWLWVYEKITTPLPQNVILKDANEIISRDKVFSYKHYNQYGHGKGSYAGFSDIFRYAVLYKYGGWWCDMDVTLLKKLDFNTEYVFRRHHIFKVVGNLMKCPPQSLLMKSCYETAINKINENNKNWNLPIEILNNYIKKYKLEHYIKDFTTPDNWFAIRRFLVKNKNINENIYAIHWINEEWRRHNISKRYFIKNSLIGILLKKYNVKYKKANFLNSISLKVKCSIFYSLILLLLKPNSFITFFKEKIKI